MSSFNWPPLSATGTVTSVGLSEGSTVPIYTISNSPVTSSGVLGFTLKTQVKNTVFSGPASGSDAQPAFRSLVVADIPSVAGNTTVLKAPTIQKFLSGSGTYNLPSGPAPLYLRITMVGGGGGGRGSGTASQGSGGTGGDTTFGTTLLVASGGVGASDSNGLGALGGSASLGSGPIGLALAGSAGGSGLVATIATVAFPGGVGGTSALGGAGLAGAGGTNTSGGAGVTNSGSGGGGGGGSAVGMITGGGGGSGGSISATITAPSSTYAYAIGAAGAGGAAGTSGSVGGAGGSGQIIVQEFYQ